MRSDHRRPSVRRTDSKVELETILQAETTHAPIGEAHVQVARCQDLGRVLESEQRPA